MRVNAWITLENTLALTWWDYYKWLRDGQQGPEPVLDEFGKKALRKLVDLEFAFKCFKKADIQGRQWRLLSIYDVTDNQLNAGYTQYGDAEEGGDYAVVGKWTWTLGDPRAQIDLQWNWRPNQVVAFMPDRCAEPPECTQYEAASYVWDVNLLAGQPPRVFPQAKVLVN